MERRDDAVQPPWEAMWYQPEKLPQPLPAGTRVLEVFDKPEIKRQLLILGEPGSGKTTTMLELARDLLERAKGDNSQPIPVLVSLSSWKKPEVGIFEWLVAELKAKYGLRQDLGKVWIQKGKLLPLLDGLDEVETRLQRKYAEAMNAWLTGELDNKPCGVLVCCRREEFEKIVGITLSVPGAIYLQALTPAQIEEYFLQFELQDVWQTVRDDAVLRELLAKPLFLSMFGLVQIQGKFELAAWQARATSEEKIEYLFDTYWDAVMSRELISPHEKKLGWLSQTYKTKPLPQRKAVRRMLVFVAKAMERDPRIGTEFLIERMQPSWLPKRKQKIISILVFGRKSITTVEEKSISISHETRQEIVRKRHNLIGDLIWVLIEGLILARGLIGVLILGLIGVLILGLIGGCQAEVQTRINPNQGIKNSIKNMAIVMTIILLSAFPFKLLLEYLLTMTQVDPNLSRSIVSVTLFVLIWAGFSLSGGWALLQHIALRIVLAWNGYAPFRFDLLLNYCTERLLLQRIGGRYRFMHKLLQDHFAKMELD
jgi:DNA polymerase III delta prime subunit